MPENKYNIFTTFLLHLHPKSLDRRSLIFTRTFGLGGISALLFIILAISGVMIKFHYTPTSDAAYYSIIQLQSETQLGQFIRNVHFWSAQLLIVSTVLHLLRVFLSFSVYHERKRNWYYGLALLFLVISFNFTGYLLPWDQLSFWAITLVTQIPSYIPYVGEGISFLLRSGTEVNDQTLLLYYNLHTTVFPAILIIVLSLHLYLVRKAKGVTYDQRKEKEILKTYPNLVYREAFVAILLLLFIFLLAFSFNAPLLEAAQALNSPDQITAPWYFGAFQVLLVYNHPLVVLILIPLIIIVFGIYVVRYPLNNEKVGQWFYNEHGKSVVLSSTLFAIFINIILILVNEYFLWNFTAGLWLNFIFFSLTTALFIFIIKRKYKMTFPLISLSLFAIFFASYLVLSLSNVFLIDFIMK